MVSEIGLFNGECDAMVGVTLNDLCAKVELGLFIAVPINSSHTTSYRLPMITFALGRTV